MNEFRPFARAPLLFLTIAGIGLASNSAPLSAKFGTGNGITAEATTETSPKVSPRAARYCLPEVQTGSGPTRKICRTEAQRRALGAEIVAKP